MPDLPKYLQSSSPLVRSWTVFAKQLNFYRVHLIVFTLVPLITSAIMWGANTEFTIPYIDCLFLCMSAMTVTGLATVNLSTLNPFQQSIIFVQMVVGNTVFVSIVSIAVRRHFFRQTLDHVVKEKQQRGSFSLAKTFTKVATAAPAPLAAFRRRFGEKSGANDRGQVEMKERSSDEQSSSPASAETEPAHSRALDVPDHMLKLPSAKRGGKKTRQPIDKNMIRRVDGGGVGLVNPMGWYDRTATPVNSRPASPESTPAPTPSAEEDRPERHWTMKEGQREETNGLPSPGREVREDSGPRPHGHHVIGSGDWRPIPAGLDGSAIADDDDDDDEPAIGNGLVSIIRTESPPQMQPSESPRTPLAKMPYAGRPLTDEAFPRSKTIAFNDEDDGMSHAFHDRGATTAREGGFFPRTATQRSQGEDGRIPRSGTNTSFPRTYSLRPSVTRKQPDTRLTGFGGFPTPFEILRNVADRVAPQTSRSLAKTLTLHRTNTIAGRGTMVSENTTVKEVPYISFSAVIGRNSHFKDLTDEQMDELGGVEYRALKVLLVIVICYIAFLQIGAFIIFAPYIGAQGRYDHVFRAQPRNISVPWFALFQSVSSFSNTGMSLADQSMIPFQSAYLMIFIMIFLIFAGNTAFPVFLRLTVWTVYKMMPIKSRLRETLKFLLDHPRRCFIYMFPSTQTWVLGLVMTSLYMTDWVTFLVLDLGTPEISSIPIGRRIASGFLQSAAVRAAGFGIVTLNALAPAVKVLYVIMMYISVYPIALSVRSTNVYEEKSLGLFNDEPDDEFESNEQGAQAVAKYLGWHARRQLAFDIWWIGFALWLVCIIERGKIDDGNNPNSITIFSIIFELVSAYGTVGLSLGVSYDNFSLSGGFSTLSKLVVIAVMLRGRHRGLPVAIDRAVMLPSDFTAAESQTFEEERSRRASRRGSMAISEDALNSFRRGSMASTYREASPGEGRKGSDPTPIPTSTPVKRSGSISTSTPGGGGVPSSPQSGLQFNLPRTSGERQRLPVAFHSGSLTPVKESSMSRAPTRVEDDGA